MSLLLPPGLLFPPSLKLHVQKFMFQVMSIIILLFTVLLHELCKFLNSSRGMENKGLTVRSKDLDMIIQCHQSSAKWWERFHYRLSENLITMVSSNVPKKGQRLQVKTVCQKLEKIGIDKRCCSQTGAVTPYTKFYAVVACDL